MDRCEASSQHSSSGTEEIFLANIKCCFGVPKEITVNNAKQFGCHIFKDFYHQMGLKQLSHRCITLSPMEQWKK
jgi:hypothetical protein